MKKTRSVVRQFIDWQVQLSHSADRLVPEKYRVVGRHHFRDVILPSHLTRGLVVYDVGGGSAPCLTLEQKNALGIRLVGLDISADELKKAPTGTYDEIIVSDITTHVGKADADLVVCQATMEHVKNTDSAFRGLASLVKPGGHLILVVPSRNAIFARINLILPEGVKRRVLFSLFPQKALGHDGFPAFYHQCTPQEFRKLASAQGFNVTSLTPYYYSSYFSFFVPLFVFWRAWVLLFASLRGEQAAEVFSMVCHKNS